MNDLWLSIIKEDVDCNVLLYFWFMNQILLLLLEEEDEVDDGAILFALWLLSLNVYLIDLMRD